MLQAPQPIVISYPTVFINSFLIDLDQ